MTFEVSSSGIAFTMSNFKTETKASEPLKRKEFDDIVSNRISRQLIKKSLSDHRGGHILACYYVTVTSENFTRVENVTGHRRHI